LLFTQLNGFVGSGFSICHSGPALIRGAFLKGNMMNRIIKIITTLPVVALLSIFMLASQAPSAQAATARNGVCEVGEFCYYYNSNQAGSVSDFTASVANYATTQPSCYDFKGAGAGKGLCIKNQAASVWNRSSQTVRVYYNTNYAGAYQEIAPNTAVNLNATLKNQNASHQFISTPVVPAIQITSLTASPASGNANTKFAFTVITNVPAVSATLTFNGNTSTYKMTGSGTVWTLPNNTLSAGSRTITVKVTDALGRTVTKSINVTVSPVAVAPTVSSPSSTTSAQSAGTNNAWSNPLANISSIKITCTYNTMCAGYLHAGTDWAVGTGTKVMSMINGTVKTGTDPAAGNYMIITNTYSSVPNHPGTHTVYVYYEHLSKYLVSNGAKVTAGTIVAESGNTGQSTGAHLHVSVCLDNSKFPSKGPTGHTYCIDPTTLLH